MRRKREAVLPFEWNNDHLPKTVCEYREKYKGISRPLDENPEILDRVHEDLKNISHGGPAPVSGTIDPSSFSSGCARRPLSDK